MKLAILQLADRVQVRPKRLDDPVRIVVDAAAGLLSLPLAV